MKHTTHHFVLEAEQPIAHHEESFGNSASAMRRRIRTADGDFVRVPIVTADTIRHGLREASSYALLDAAGLLGANALTEAALRLLFSGGMITGAAGGSVKLSDYRTLIDLVPPLALLGGCAQNRAVPGQIEVSDATLICEESLHLLRDDVRAWVLEVAGEPASMRQHVEEVQRVRMDPSLQPEKRNLLTGGELDAIEQRLLKSENSSAMGDAKGKDEAKSSMMPRRFETVVAGSRFYCQLTARTYDDLQEDTLLAMLGAFFHHAVVGGKKGTGHGKLRLIGWRDAVMYRPAERFGTMSLATLEERKIGKLFRAHVQERKEQIAAFLDKVSA